jgi:YVTN family beta-propeller protein
MKNRLLHLCCRAGTALMRLPARLLRPLFFVLLLAACQPGAPTLYREPLGEEGELAVYVQPFAQDTARLRFSLQGLAAIREDGTAVPLSLAFAEFTAGEMKSQRLLATGLLPPGNYQGLSFQVKEALLKDEEGESALLIPQGPQTVPFAFHIGRRRAALLLLDFDYGRAVQQRFSFAPAFSVFVPEKPVPGLIGYVANYGSNDITVIDKKAMQAVGLIATGKGPIAVAMDRIRNRAYVALAEADAVAAIDITGGEVISEIRLNPGDFPRDLAITPAGDLLVAANGDSNTVSLVDPLLMLEVERIAVDNGPHSVLMAPDGKRAFVFNSMSGTLSVIDIANRSLAATVSVGESPLRGAFNRAGDRLFIINDASPYLTVLDPDTLQVLERAHVGSGMRFIMVDPRTDLIYIARRHETAVQIYDPFALLPVDALQAEEETVFMTIDREENRLYLLHDRSGRLSVFGLISKKKISGIDAGAAPAWLTLMSER